MGKKTLSLNPETLEQLKLIKDQISINPEDSMSWDNVFEHLLSVYDQHKRRKDVPHPKVKESSVTEKNINISLNDLGIPLAPTKKPVKIISNQQTIEDIARKETTDTKFILIECHLCGKVPIVMPVPKDLILNAQEPVVDVSYVHGDPVHVVTAQLDHDFQVRRQRSCSVVFEKDRS